MAGYVRYGADELRGYHLCEPTTKFSALEVTVPAPTSDLHAATKKYVDDEIIANAYSYPHQSDVIYFANTGSHLNDGLTPATPKATLAQALAAVPGNADYTVMCLDGHEETEMAGWTIPKYVKVIAPGCKFTSGADIIFTGGNTFVCDVLQSAGVVLEKDMGPNLIKCKQFIATNTGIAASLGTDVSTIDAEVCTPGAISLEFGGTLYFKGSSLTVSGAGVGLVTASATLDTTGVSYFTGLETITFTPPFTLRTGNVDLTAPVTWSGPWGATTKLNNLKIKKTGNVVTFEGGAGDVASVAVVAASTAIPVYLRPPSPMFFPIFLLDNVTSKFGQVGISDAGLMQVSVGADQSAFAGAGDATFVFTVTYFVESTHP